MYWAALGIAIFASIFAQALLKSGAARADFIAQLFDWHTVLGLGVYGFSAMLYIVALRRIPMSVALPSTAVSYVAALAIGHFAFGEPVGLVHIGAVTMICGGVALLAAAG
jgi:multidrug transporter EmrE-like cation transporter